MQNKYKPSRSSKVKPMFKKDIYPAVMYMVIPAAVRLRRSQKPHMHARANWIRGAATAKNPVYLVRCMCL
jgi:hypothetical protein